MKRPAFALMRVVVRGGAEPPTFRFSGALVWSLYVAGQGLISDLAAQTMADCRLVCPDICRRWLPAWLPDLVSAANVRYLEQAEDRDATAKSPGSDPGDAHIPGIPPPSPSQPTAPAGPLSSPPAVVSTHEATAPPSQEPSRLLQRASPTGAVNPPTHACYAGDLWDFLVNLDGLSRLWRWEPAVHAGR